MNDKTRDIRIWTDDLVVPNAARYQAALHPEEIDGNGRSWNTNHSIAQQTRNL